MYFSAFRKYCLVFALLSSIAILNGCVVKDISRTVEHTVKGDYYLKSEKFDQGRDSFRAEVEENPSSALANYYYGRFLLYDKDYKQALKYLQKARDLDPGNADYHFWTGIAHAGLKNPAKEEQNYRQALKINPKHLQSLVYVGHSQLEKKKYYEALTYYNRALGIWPGSPSALYNRALIMKRLGRTPEEKLAWHEYLSIYPSGAMARRATANLNYLGDFAYRNHTLGPRTITTEKIYFEPFSSKLSEASIESLNLVGGVVEKMNKGKLQIVSYQKKNKTLAQKRAGAIKKYLTEEFSGLSPQRIGISWFSEPQTLTIGKKKLKIDESVSFFITQK
jgi:tetratricopeptide (TPR) repeat protein